jgi:DNA-binding MarR family transcriptional regulator
VRVHDDAGHEVLEKGDLDRVAEIGASKAAYGVLAVIEEFGPSSQSDLGRRLGMDRRSVSEEVVSLEQRGFVSRGPDPADSPGSSRW